MHDESTRAATSCSTPRPLALYLAVGLGAGAVIALQIDIMRVFAVGNWTHFGSLVVSLAMLGFGLTSAVMSVAKNWFSRHWRLAAGLGLGLMGPLAVGANLYIQQLGFNPIYLVSDPHQKWKLAQIFLASLTPFLGGAVFLGSSSSRATRRSAASISPISPARASAASFSSARCMCFRRSI